MNIDENPRPMLSVNAMECWFLDPIMIPFALTTPPHIPHSTMGDTYDQPHPPALDVPPAPDVPPVAARPRAGLRALLQIFHPSRP